MTIKKLRLNTLEKIERFNEEVSFDEVFDTLGIEYKGNGAVKSCCCPLHNGDNPQGSSIHLRKNIFSCWTSDCGQGLTPFNFIQKYFELDFKETLIKCNDLFNTDFKIITNRADREVKFKKKADIFDRVIYTEKYLSYVNNELRDEVFEHKHILLNANTGVGKTYGISELAKGIIRENVLRGFVENDDNKVDLVILLVPTRSIAEQVTEKFKHFELFYGNDLYFPNSSYVVSTYNKVNSVVRALEYKEALYSSNGKEFKYMTVIDEVHELVNKRGLLNKKYVSQTMEELLKDSTYSISMSANTFNVNMAYKESGIFNRYIKVDQKERQYNAKSLDIYRLPTKERAKFKIIANKIDEDLKSYDNVLYMEDNKKNLEILATNLEAKGIDVKFITSSNKNEEDIFESYEAIIKDNTLKNTVILTTSLINAGVSIEDNNVSVMIRQGRTQLDFDKIQQFFARIRVSDQEKSDNNKLTLFITQNSDSSIRGKKMKVTDFESSLDTYLQYARNLAFEFNMYHFNELGAIISDYEEKDIDSFFETCCKGGRYAQVLEGLYLENGILKVDEVGIYNLVRLNWYKENYYNDEYIIEMLQDVNVKAINEVRYLDNVKSDDVILIESEDMSVHMRAISEDNEALADFYKFINRDIKLEDMESSLVINLHETFRSENKYKKMLRNIREILNRLSHLEDSNRLLVFMSLIEAYSLEKTKEVTEEITRIQRVEVYNKDVKLGNTERALLLGDEVYGVVRANYDCYATSKNKPSKTPFIRAINQYCNIYDLKKAELPVRKGSSKKDVFYANNKGKKILVADLEAQIIQCVNDVYNISPSGRLTGLK